MSSEILFASTARTATPAVVEFSTGPGYATIVIVDITAVTATPSVVFDIDGFDPASGKWYTILASAAQTGTGQVVMRVGPGDEVTANVSANSQLPERMRVTATHADADSITYSVGLSLIGK